MDMERLTDAFGQHVWRESPGGLSILRNGRYVALPVDEC